MKKTLLLCFFTLLLGLIIGLMLNFCLLGGFGLPVSRPVSQPSGSELPMLPLTTPPVAIPDLTDNSYLLTQGNRVLEAVKAEDFKALALLVHPQQGVRLTTFSTVDVQTDLTLTAAQVAEGSDDGNKYLWGYGHGSGLKIDLTIQDYFKSYVWNADYTLAPIIGINHVNASGNSLENVAEAYPDCRFLEYYYPGRDPANAGLDWCALKLVFAEYNGTLKLVGLIHSEWTI